jgi:AraC-like DNA-binding protein
MSDPEYYSYTLESLSEMSGFRNRTTFVNSFKRFKNSSPSSYWKWIRLNPEFSKQVSNRVHD